MSDLKFNENDFAISTEDAKKLQVILDELSSGVLKSDGLIDRVNEEFPEFKPGICAWTYFLWWDLQKLERGESIED